MSLLREGDNERREEFGRTMLGNMETYTHFIDKRLLRRVGAAKPLVYV